MNIDLLLDNLTNPALLFFLLGLIAVALKSDLEIPPTSSKFISIYLLFSIGFKGGQELVHSPFSWEIIWSILLGIFVACFIPFYTFFILKKRVGIYNAAAISAAYGSISAVTFITAVSYLDHLEQSFGGHMVAIMALMEAPAIIIGLLLLRLYLKDEPGTDAGLDKPNQSIKEVVLHSFANASVLIILGSLIIGTIASDEQAQGIKPFTTDIFNGFLAIFLLDMGISSGRKLGDFVKNGRFVLLFAILIPLINGSLTALLSGLLIPDAGNRFMLAILAASASYIAVPAAMKNAVPQANPSIYLPMALAITFPFNITLGMPIYWWLVNLMW
jgi:uncharacterized protein